MKLRLAKKKVVAGPEYQVRMALTEEAVEAAVAEAMEQGVVGLDTETTGCDPSKESPVITARAFSVQIAWGNVAYFIPTFHIDGVCDFSKLVAKLAPLVKTASNKLVLHNAKYDFHVLENAGLRPHSKCLLADTMVMSYTNNNGHPTHGLKENVKRWFGEDTAEFKPTFRVPKLKKDGKPGKAMRSPELYEVIMPGQDHVEVLFEERARAFRKKLGGTERAAQELYEACGEKISLAGAELIIAYASLDPIYTVRLFNLMKEKMEAQPWANGNSLYYYFQLMEVPFTMTLYRVERRGIPISKRKLLVARALCEKHIKDSLIEFNRLAVKSGAPVSRMAKFNTNSGKDIAWLFSEVIGVKASMKRRKNGTSSESWDAKTLEKLKSNKKAKPLVDALLEYRAYSKTLSTYITPFLHQYEVYGGRLHTTLKQIGTATGRLSSSNPNVQNAPTGPKDPCELRACFIAYERGRRSDKIRMVMGDIDLAQVEARIAAHISRDPGLVEAIEKGWDLHSLTALKSFDSVRDFVGVREITAEVLAEIKEKFPDERKAAKIIFFGSLYGQGAKGFAESSGFTERDAQIALDNFFSGYAGLKASMRKIQMGARDKGHVRSPLRRYLHVPDSMSHDQKKRARGDRQSYNYVIQGGCADMVKMSMVLIEQDKKLKKMGVKMRLQIHDELLFTLPAFYKAAAKPIIEKYMSRPFECFGFKPLSVETPADIDFGKSWKEAKK